MTAAPSADLALQQRQPSRSHRPMMVLAAAALAVTCIDHHPPKPPDAAVDAPIMCAVGMADCNRDPRDGCETNIWFDKNNCGACGSVCPVTTGSVGTCGCITPGCGMCVPCSDPRTGRPQANCDLDPSNGCEVDLFFDAKNCGACGQACPAGEMCSVGRCFRP